MCVQQAGHGWWPWGVEVQLTHARGGGGVLGCDVGASQGVTRVKAE